MKNPLLDLDFIKDLYRTREKTKYIKIITFDHSGFPLETLEGVATGGSISLDGKSAARRSCSLTFAAQRSADWALSTEFELFIGERNNINSSYPDIIWFPMGRYLISSLNSNLQVNNYSISLQGKDKIAKLNGEMGGMINSLAVDFGKVDEVQPDGTTVTRKLKLEEIIREIVHVYGGEPYHNIIINDLPEYGFELWEYQNSQSMYLLFTEGKEYYTYFLDGTTTVYVNGAPIPLSGLDEYLTSFHVKEIVNNPTLFTLTNEEGATQYQAMRLDAGEIAGYHPCDLIYAQELIVNIGQAVTAALDKIVSMLGYFEYFYDTDGRFVFQKKPMLLSLENSDAWGLGDTSVVPAAADQRAVVYSFDDDIQFTQLQNNYNIANIKNDFTVWGSRDDLPIHMRYAIDKKPVYYKNYNGEEYTIEFYDWREIIYQMALDQSINSRKKDFRTQLMKNNFDYPTGYTGYEQYYTDLLGFWRTVYDPNPPAEYEKVLYNDDRYPQKYIHAFEPITVEQWSKIDKTKIYTTKKSDQMELQRWIDTYDFSKIKKNENEYYHWDDMWYKDKKIIDSLDFRKNNVYIKDGDKYCSLLDSLSREEQDNVYIAFSQYHTKEKLFNYYLVDQYKDNSLIYDNALYIQTQDSKEKKMIWEIELEGEVIWQYNDEPMDFRFIEVIAEAVRSHPTKIQYTAEGLDERSFEKSSESINVRARRADTEFEVYYKEEDNKYVYLSDKILNYSKNPEELYSKYNVYFRLDDLYYSSIELINIDKSSIMINDSLSSEYVHLVNAILKLSKPINMNNLYLISSDKKVSLNDLNSDLQQIYQGAPKEIEKSILQLNGNESRYYKTKIKTFIKYYRQYYNYRLTENGNYKNCWRLSLYDDFNSALFWFDFIEPNSSYVGKYSVRNIGTRPKAENNKSATGLDYNLIKDIYFVDEDFEKEDDEKIYITLNEELQKMFTISSQSISCKDVIIQNLNTMTDIFNSINLSIVPLYILQPNEEIIIRNKELYGRYSINTINIPLAYDGLMQLQVIKQNENSFRKGVEV